VSVEIVDEKASTGDPLQLGKKLHGIRVVKVVEEEGRVHDVDGAVRI
jgi:hypothetical protein